MIVAKKTQIQMKTCVIMLLGVRVWVQKMNLRVKKIQIIVALVVHLNAIAKRAFVEEEEIEKF